MPEENVSKFECPNPKSRIRYESLGVYVDWELNLSPEMQKFYKDHCQKFSKIIGGGCSSGPKSEFCELIMGGLSCIACKEKFDKQYSN